MFALLSRCLLCFLLCLATTGAIADTLRGTPLLHRFQPEDYNATPQHWGITTDGSGRLYVANVEGVLRYDGDHWQLIELPGKNIARDVVTGHDGHIYVGSYDSFGWLKTSPDGDVVYEELLTAAGLKGKDRDLGVIWQIIPTDDGIYVHAEHSLLFLSYDHSRTKSWPLAESIRSFYAVGNTLYARDNGRGFCQVVDGKFLLEPGGELFATQPLAEVLPEAGWMLLIGEQGFYRADPQGIAPMPDHAGAELQKNNAYTALQLSDGSLVVGAKSGDVFRYGPDFKLRERVKLGSYSILALGADKEGGLWVGTEGELVRMSLPSPWSFIGAAQGLAGNVLDYEWYDGALWVASSQGFMRLTPGSDGKINVEPTNFSDMEAYALEATDSGLLMGHRNGLMVLDPGSTKPRSLYSAEQEGVSELHASRFDPDLIYGLGDQHLFEIRRKDGRWQAPTTVPLDGASAFGLVETARNEIWFGDGRGGPQRWTLDPVSGKLLNAQVFGARDGLELDPQAGSSVYLFEGHIHALSGEKGFRFDGSKFLPEIGPPFTLVDRPNELSVEETPLGTYAFTSRQLWFRAIKGKQWQPLHLGSQLAAGYGRVRYNKDGVLRVATWSGLLQFNPEEKQPVPIPLVLGFDLVTAESPDGEDVRHLPIVSQGKPIEIPEGYRLHFRYGLVSMDSGLQFRYKVHGIAETETWTDVADRDLFIKAITSGDYVLEVQARTHAGRMSSIASYRYRILPAWYERWWVELLGLLLLFGLIALAVQEFIRRRTQRYLEANRRLEARIAERTHELENVNKKLAELATEDALTGVSNRRALEQGLQREWYRCMDQRRPLSVLMIDVDHFKRYNDTHGHLEGDVLLRAIAQRLQSEHDPKRELLSRYGGEEFALLLPGVHLDEAQRRAEQVRAAMQEHAGGATVSIGVAGFVPSVQSESATLLRRADAALYRAKRAGRNRVEIDNDPPPR
jgi:diguanylate cyclase (GGDEF)-like protein